MLRTCNQSIRRAKEKSTGERVLTFKEVPLKIDQRVICVRLQSQAPLEPSAPVQSRKTVFE